MALDEVYSKGINFNKWLEKWHDTDSHDFFDSILVKQREWCMNNQINFTPALFINGKKYPSEYEFEHLRFFIEDLVVDSSEEILQEDAV